MAIIDISNIVGGLIPPGTTNINLPSNSGAIDKSKAASSADKTMFTATGINSARRMTLTIAEREIQTGINMVNTAESTMSLISADLDAISAKAQTAADSSTTDSERAVLQSEIDELVERIEYNVAQASFGGASLFTGNTSSFAIGDDASGEIEVKFSSISEKSLGLQNLDVTTQTAAESGVVQVYESVAKLQEISAGFTRDKGLLQDSLDELTKIRSLDVDTTLYELDTTSTVNITGGITPYTAEEAEVLLATQSNKLDSGIVNELLK